MSKKAYSADNQQERSDKERIGYFLAGFVEGEGSFNISLKRRRHDYRLGWQVILRFNVSQKDPNLLRILTSELGCGVVRTRKRDGLHFLDVANPKDIVTKVIPYFKRYPLLSPSKIRNFEIFCEVSKLMWNREYKSEHGLRRIVELRELINEGKGRKRKYGIQDVFPIQESPQTIRQTPA